MEDGPISRLQARALCTRLVMFTGDNDAMMPDTCKRITSNVLSTKELWDRAAFLYVLHSSKLHA